MSVIATLQFDRIGGTVVVMVGVLWAWMVGNRNNRNNNKETDQ